MFRVHRHIIYITGYRPEQTFDLGTGMQINQPEIEQSQAILTYLHGIMPRFD